MKAMIFAAGRGERMRPLTDTRPKPLIEVRGKPLIEWHLLALQRAGIKEVVINTAWLEEQIVQTLGSGERWGMTLHYSMEGRDHGGALETAGGIAKALPWLGDVFWVVSSDSFLPEFEFSAAAWERFASSAAWAHLWLVPNPEHHPKGDFALASNGQVSDQALPRLTWSSVGLLRRELVANVQVGIKQPLGPLLHAAAQQGRITGECYTGLWMDVGTLERLNALKQA